MSAWGRIILAQVVLLCVWTHGHDLAGDREDAHKVLGVSRGASVGDVKAAYRSLAKLAHPDRSGTHEAMQELNAAYSVLLSGDAPHQHHRQQRYPRERPKSKKSAERVEDVFGEDVLGSLGRPDHPSRYRCATVMDATSIRLKWSSDSIHRFQLRSPPHLVFVCFREDAAPMTRARSISLVIVDRNTVGLPRETDCMRVVASGLRRGVQVHLSYSGRPGRVGIRISETSPMPNPGEEILGPSSGMEAIRGPPQASTARAVPVDGDAEIEDRHVQLDDGATGTGPHDGKSPTTTCWCSACPAWLRRWWGQATTKEAPRGSQPTWLR